MSANGTTYRLCLVYAANVFIVGAGLLAHFGYVNEGLLCFGAGLGYSLGLLLGFLAGRNDR